MVSKVEFAEGSRITIKNEGAAFHGLITYSSPKNIIVRFDGSPEHHAGFKFSKNGLFGGNGIYGLFGWYMLSLSPTRWDDIQKAIKAGG